MASTGSSLLKSTTCRTRTSTPGRCGWNGLDPDNQPCAAQASADGRHHSHGPCEKTATLPPMGMLANSAATNPVLGPDAMAQTRFIKQAQRKGFTIGEIIELLALRLDSGAAMAAFWLGFE